MKTLERARVIKANCHAVIGARYSIQFDIKYNCFRVLRASRGILQNCVLIESAF